MKQTTHTKYILPVCLSKSCSTSKTKLRSTDGLCPKDISKNDISQYFMITFLNENLNFSLGAFFLTLNRILTSSAINLYMLN